MIEPLIKTYTFTLKACPFCGFTASLFGVQGGGFKAACENEDCGCSLPAWMPFDKDEDAMEKIDLAVKYWNERAQ